jgi:hypothetical protein
VSLKELFSKSFTDNKKNKKNKKQKTNNMELLDKLN